MFNLRWIQSADHVLVRDPAKRRYNPPEAAAKYAQHHWEYAAMCSFAYERARLRACGTQPLSSVALDAELAEEADALERHGWSRWADFPADALLGKLSENGVYADVWERVAEPRVIAVIFEGTKPLSLADWRSNLRWLFRFLPSFEDHYTIAADEICREFFERIYTLKARYAITIGNPTLLTGSGNPIKLIAAGHSLGGGLAQHFAYAFQQPFASGGPKVSEVFAFDASPVTGWSVVPRGQRTYNATNLRINRIFEHGEVLAYVRLLTSRLSRYSANPSVWEYRYNVGVSWNIVKNHSMRLLARGLMKAAGISSAKSQGSQK